MFDRTSKVKFKVNISERTWCMPQEPAPADPGRDEDPFRRAAEPEGPAVYEPVPWEPVVTRPDWMTGEDWQAYLDAAVGDDEPSDEEEDPPPEDYDLAEIDAECRQIAEDQARAAANAARLGVAGDGRRDRRSAAGSGAARVSPPLRRGVPRPGRPVRHRDDDGYHARPPRARAVC